MLVPGYANAGHGLYGHGLSVAVGLLAFGRHLGYPERNNLLAAWHAWNVVGHRQNQIPEQILRKTPA